MKNKPYLLTTQEKYYVTELSKPIEKPIESEFVKQYNRFTNEWLVDAFVFNKSIWDNKKSNVIINRFFKHSNSFRKQKARVKRYNHLSCKYLELYLINIYMNKQIIVINNQLKCFNNIHNKKIVLHPIHQNNKDITNYGNVTFSNQVEKDKAIILDNYKPYSLYTPVFKCDKDDKFDRYGNKKEYDEDGIKKFSDFPYYNRKLRYKSWRKYYVNKYQELKPKTINIQTRYGCFDAMKSSMYNSFVQPTTI